MARLRDPQRGCPWDLQQTFRSIAPYTVEEAYEVADAIERGAVAELADELGDLLLQVVFHARMAEEQGQFGFADVVDRICDKMRRRHPHVFGDDPVGSAADQSREWDAIKQRERGCGQAALAGIPLNLPALSRAAKLGRRAARVGFDWPSIGPVRDKVDEELAELDAAVAHGDRAAIEAEVGDLLFAVVNVCRHLDADPEQCLRGANRRFESRFGRVEEAVQQGGGDWKAFDLAQLERFWQRAKMAESG
jgi:MazG family protein